MKISVYAVRLERLTYGGPMMDRHIRLTLGVALFLVVSAVGCNSGSKPEQATASNDTGSSAKDIPTDPAARATYDFLEAVVKADDKRVSQLLTPLAMQKIQASGKSIHLPGLDNYKFHVAQVRYLSENDALVQCIGADHSGGKDVQEEHEWMLHKVDNQWRIAAIAFQPDPKGADMIYSFEHPEWGPIPAQQFRARMMAAAQPQPTADNGTAQTTIAAGVTASGAPAGGAAIAAGATAAGSATGPILGNPAGTGYDIQSAGGQTPRTAQEGQTPSYR
jgi:hypothetical protein